MRPDRDDFINVNWENIAPEMMKQFVKRSHDYDYQDYNALMGWRGNGGIGGISSMQVQTPYDVLSVNSVRKEIVFLKSSI